MTIPSGRLLLLCTFLLTLLTACGSTLEEDEEVMLFTTSASYNSNDQTWTVPIHGWVFEREEDSLWRRPLLAGLRKLLDLDEATYQSELFKKRAQWFLIDNERGQRLEIQIANTTVNVGPTGANGHFETQVKLSREHIPSPTTERWLTIKTNTATTKRPPFATQIQLLSEQGISVISDIDDTIKISNVRDKKALLRNTFTKEFEAVPAISTVYHQWYQQGVDFHYVSASPWQLYPALTEFIQRAGFPHGSFHMKLFRVKDESFNNLFVSAIDYKLPLISAILQKYPKRQFILVGDSGEKDPEVYAEVLHRFALQIKHVFIRDVTDETKTSPRYTQLFKGELQHKLTVFNDARVLMQYPLPINNKTQ